MNHELRIASLGEADRVLPGVEPSDIALHVTPGVLRDIATTVGTRRPETGAMILGPWTRGGADRLEFDEKGSDAASAGVYAPDTKWANSRVAFWTRQPDDELRVWHGQVHSHPGKYARPSPAAGRGMGDIGYVAETFRVNEVMQDFFLPIVTGAGTPDPLLWSWVVSRAAPDTVRYAEVKVGPAAEFPARRFNTEWEAREDGAAAVPTIRQTPEPSVPLFPLDVAEIAAKAGAVLTRVNGRFVCTLGPISIALAFPENFPIEPPVVSVLGPVEARFPFGWRKDHPYRVELRLSRLLRNAFRAAGKEF